MTYALKFGSYTLPNTFAPVYDPHNATAMMAQTPRMNGANVATRYLTGKQLRVTGGFTSMNGAGVVQSQIDTLLSNLQGTQNLYFGDSDRYYRNAKLIEAPINYDQNSYTRYARDIDLVFNTGDPYQYSNTLTSSATNAMSTSPKSLSITTTGHASALPKFTFSTSGATSVAMTFTQSTTGEVFTLSGTIASGATIVVDSLEMTVTISGTDYMSLFEGVFPSLASGANTISIAWTAGGFTNVAYEYRNRWY